MSETDETLPLDREPDPTEAGETLPLARGSDPAETADLAPTAAHAAETQDVIGETRDPAGDADTQPAGERSGTSGSIGPYRLERELGKGGMGAVYLAYSEKLDRQVALKVLHASSQVSEEHRERFELEARAAARLRHEGIVAVHDVGEHRGVPYIVMEYVPGESLQARVERGPVEPREAVRLIEQVARALAYAHAAGILHRDLKPANILVDDQGRARIADFGLARDLEQTTERKTRTGDVLGTPLYMPPEQARGDMAVMDRRADVYSLGATLYELLSGEPAFDAKTVAQLLQQVLHDEPLAPSRRLPGINRDLDTICLKCLEKDPERRYPSAHDLAEDLRRYLAHEPILARPPGLADRVGKWTKRNRLAAQILAASVGFVLVGSLAGGAVFLDRLATERDNARAAAEQARLAKLEAEAAQERAEKESARAAHRALIAQSALRVLVTEVRTELVRVPGDRALRARKRLLAHALEGLDRLAETSGDDAPYEDFVAASMEIGDLAYETGDMDRAIRAFQSSERRSRAELDAKGDMARGRLSTALMRLGDASHSLGRLDAARGYWTESLALRRALAAERDSDATWRRVARTLERICTLHKDAGELDAAVAAADELLTIKAFEDQPGMVTTLCFLSDVDRQNGRFVRSMQRVEQALVLLAKLQKKGDWGRLELTHARTLSAKADLLVDLYRFDEAQAVLEEATGICAQAHRATPSSRLFLEQLVSDLTTLANVHVRAEDPETAWKTTARALPLTTARLAKSPDDLAILNAHGLLLSVQGRAALALGKHDVAMKAFQESLQTCDRLDEVQPGNHITLINRPIAVQEIAEAHEARGELGKARETFRKALDLLEKAALAKPSHDLINLQLPSVCQKVAKLELKEGRFEAAQQALERAIRQQRSWIESQPEDERAKRNLAVTLAYQAQAFEIAREYDRAHAILDECEILRRWLMERPGADRRRVVRDLFALMERRVLVYRAQRDLDGEIEASKKAIPVVTELAEFEPRFRPAIKQYEDWVKRLERFKAKQERKSRVGER